MKHPIRQQIVSDGYAILRGGVSESHCSAMCDLLPQLNGAGLRGLIAHAPNVIHLLEAETVRTTICHILGPEPLVVRSILFDKQAGANWAVAPHRDQTIAVQTRIDIAGFGPWSVKDGVPHVQPPSVVLDGMLTARVHLDAAGADNGGLLVWPGTHIGREAQGDPVLIDASPGDVLLMRPRLVHASKKANILKRRRVAHFEMASCRLPQGLMWAETHTLRSQAHTGTAR
jgi:hypothetical protein